MSYKNCELQLVDILQNISLNIQLVLTFSQLLKDEYKDFIVTITTKVTLRHNFTHFEELPMRLKVNL